MEKQELNYILSFTHSAAFILIRVQTMWIFGANADSRKKE